MTVSCPTCGQPQPVPATPEQAQRHADALARFERWKARRRALNQHTSPEPQ